MKKYILTILLILAVLISYGQSDPAPTAPANAVSIQGFAKITGADTVHTGYQSGFGFIDIAGRSWTKRNFASALIPTSVKTTNYTAAERDLVLVNTTSGSITITLPTKVTDKSLIAIKHIIQSSANTVTINASGTDVFNKAGGAASVTLKLLNQGVLLQYSYYSGIWYILSDDLPLSSLDSRYVNSLTTSSGSTPTLVNGVLNIPPTSGSGGSTSVANPTALSGLTAVNGTATTAMRSDGAPAINQTITPNWTGLHTYTQNALGTTLTDAILAQNTTAAIAGTGQNSPAIHWKGNVWSTSASASKSIDFWANTLSYQNGNGAGFWQLMSSLNGGTPAQVFSVDNSGNAFCAGYFYTPQTVQIGGGLQVTGGTGYNLTISDPNYNNYASTNSAYAFAGSSSVVSRIIFNSAASANKSASLTNGQCYAGEIFATSLINTTPSTSNPWIASILINPNNVTLGLGATITNTSNLFINYPSTVGANNYALYVMGGLSRFAAVSIQTPAGLPTDSVATKSGTTGILGAVPISNFITTSAGRIGQTALVAGTKTITITGLTSSSKAFVAFVSAGGTVSSTWQYAAVCTTGTLTITALTNTGSANTGDTSTLNYNVIQ